MQSKYIAIGFGMMMAATGCEGTEKVANSGNPLTSLTASTMFQSAPELFGAATPANGSGIYVAWSVTATSPDYGYIQRIGRVEGGNPIIEISAAPPDEALNQGALGVGFLFIVKESFHVTEGRDTTDLEQLMDANAYIGFAANNLLVYKKPGQPSYVTSWGASFTDGYNCGVGRPPEGESGFDTVAPVDCDAMQFLGDNAGLPCDESGENMFCGVVSYLNWS